MRPQITHPKDFWSGALFAGAGTFFLWAGSNLEIGTASNMDAGYFPQVVAAVCVILGAALMFRGLVRQGEPIGYWGVRSVVRLLAAFIVFGFTLREMGLLFSGSAAMLISFFAAPDARWCEAILVSTFVVATVTVLFVLVLGLTLPIWPRVLG